ncbi:PucR family transcriptional regulator [Streptomyces sp. 8N706]|uniref:PucR family transcriptional regulator n=1 Tax=Streptomyces sp. 8N706 TaxID=3457416 RepID=UPI003FD05189
MDTTERGWLLRLKPGGEVPEPACPQETLNGAGLCLGGTTLGWGLETALTMTEEIVRRVPEHGRGEAEFQSLRRSVEATVLLALTGLLSDGQATPAHIAPEAIAGNAVLARRGIPLDRVLRGVRIGHAHLHGRLMEALDAEPESVRIPEAHRVSELLFGYADIQASRLAEEYIAERDRWQRSTEAARRHLVEEALAGRAVERETAIRRLGYDLGRHHISFIVTLRPPASPDEEVRAFAGEFARALGGQGLLTVPDGAWRLWVWTSFSAPPPPGRVAEARNRVAVPDGYRVALGPRGFGPQGFRRSHRGAREAERVGRLGGLGPVNDYAAVGIAALITADAEHARWFAAEALGGLAADDTRVAQLRETLRVYLAEGRSPLAAAERLYVARNTVTYRIKRAEELLGRPLDADGLDVRLALEIARVLGPAMGPERKGGGRSERRAHIRGQEPEVDWMSGDGRAESERETDTGSDCWDGR